jgi:hypothetical protein
MGANPLPIAAMPLTIATFNVENLYARFDFAGKVTRERRVVGTYSIEDAREYDIVRKSFEAAASDDVRQLTALAIAETEADVVCLQEVDSPQALDLFYENYLRPVLRQRFGAATRGSTANSASASRRPGSTTSARWCRATTRAASRSACCRAFR